MHIHTYTVSVFYVFVIPCRLRYNQNMTKKRKTVLLVDVFALLFRAYAAMPSLTFNNKELGAVYGFFNILFRFIEQVKPDYVISAFDREEPTLRKQKHEAYKAQREKAPDDFYAQIPHVHEILSILGMVEMSKAGYEADDIIGTCARCFSKDEYDVVILTGDKDMLQLLDAHVSVLTPKIGFGKDTAYTPEFFREKYGFSHEHWIDFKAFRGDPSDNLPGAKGIGEKTATELVSKFQTVEGVYAAIEQDTEDIKPRIKNILSECESDVKLTKELVTIDTNVDIVCTVEHTEFPKFTESDIQTVLSKYGFKGLVGRLRSCLSEDDAYAVETVTADGEYVLVTEENWKQFHTEWKKAKVFAFDTETNSLNAREAKLEGLSVSWKEKTGRYIPVSLFVNHHEEIEKIFTDRKKIKIAHHAKYDITVLQNEGIELGDLADDTMLMAYVLQPGSRGLGLKALASSKLGMVMMTYGEMAKEHADNIADVPDERIAQYAGADADMTLRLYTLLKKELKNAELLDVYETFEKPLIPVLAYMERVGISIDLDFLSKMKKELQKRVDTLSKEIGDAAGSNINIDSPKQLAELLFEKLRLPTAGIRKTKTGISTDADTLETLQDAHPIIPMIGLYREYKKLLSTYVEPLPEAVESDGRVHTSFNQTITATGRLSSSDPNMQNIPIRTDIGNQMRKAIVSAPGRKLAAIDYSQLELRIAASLANESDMIDAFANGMDIHAWTASKIHGIPLESVTKEIRRTAKEINFGVLYGMGPYGVAQRTGLSRTEAKEFIDTYYGLFPTLKSYLDAVVENAHEAGYAKTMFGRRRYIPELHSNNARVRAASERMAINFPMQGTNADIIKKAMIAVYAYRETNPHFDIVLQIHDELLFEIDEEKIDETVPELARIMESIADIAATLVVEARVGDNWRDGEKYEV